MAKEKQFIITLDKFSGVYIVTIPEEDFKYFSVFGKTRIEAVRKAETELDYFIKCMKENDK